MEQPSFFESKYVRINPKTEKWEIDDDAPQEMKDEFKEFFDMANGVPQDGKIIRR